uniref:GB1/RHD3-type G domain-containing protein n=1 Tax=Rhipicephalus pulchellus TaxID=72859 RepID=L7M063_RHIPC
MLQTTVLNMGKQVQIVSVERDGTLQLNEKELKRILLAPNVKDKPVAVVSIMGAFRQGKSFLLNFLLRYLRSRGRPNWMGDDDAPLTGFSWSTTSERNTKGIHVWDEVFPVRTPAGDELVVLLMDTQGSFDSRSSADETANLFALSILTSSIQIYNIFHNIQEDHLQHLQLVANYSMETQESTAESPFQKLVFLVRDWQFPDDKAHGAKGGRMLLEEFMSTSTEQHRDNIDLRQCLSSCFSSVDCFLMPHPGKETTRRTFDGRLSKLDEDFKRGLRVLVPWLLGSVHLDAKKIGGKKITCRQLLNCITAYTDVFKDGRRPHVATILQATAEENNRNAKEEARTFYVNQLEKATYKNLQELEEIHNVLLEKAKKIFEAARRVGGDEVKVRYLRILEEEIRLIFSCACNNQKVLDFQKKVDEMKANADEVSQMREKMKMREKELEREKRILALKSSGPSQKQKAMADEEEELKRQKAEFEARRDDLRAEMDALRKEKERLEREREELKSRAKETFSDTDGAWYFALAMLSTVFPPFGAILAGIAALIGAAFGLGRPR